jgi:hypothetical protein
MTLTRGGWALTALAGFSLCVLGPDATSFVSGVTGHDFPRAVLGLCALSQLVLSGGVVLTVVASLLPGASPLLRALTPRLLRRMLFAGTAGALALTPAHADPASAPGHTKTHDLTGLRLPDRPLTPAETPVPTVVVRPGDTLWAIAARSLPDGASNAEIARACASWYAANRRVIGDDPDRIFPAQRLAPPPGKDLT